MPVKRSPTGGWDIDVSVNRQRVHRRLPKGASQGDAKRLEAELRTALGRRADPVVPGDPSLTSVMAAYVASTKALRSPKTATYHALRIGRWCEGRRASEARQVAASIVADMTGHYAPATINRSLGTLKAGLGLVWRQGLTPTNYGEHVKRLPENNERSTVLTLAEVEKLTSCASANTRAAIWLSLYTGCRRGELLKLRAEDIGPTDILIRAGNTKTMKTRTIPIIAPLRPWLAYVPLAINAEGLKMGFRRAREKAGMPHVTYHDLRRSCATLMLQAGASLYVVSRLLGHSAVTVTEKRYAHLQTDAMRAGLELAFPHTETPATG